MNVVGRGEADGTGADIGATDEELTELVAEATALTAARAAFCTSSGAISRIYLAIVRECALGSRLNNKVYRLH